MKKVIVLFFVLSPSLLFAQNWEFGAFLGGSNYGGDLAPEPVIMEETHAAVGILGRYNFNETFSLKSQIYYGTISGSDENSPSNSWRRERNLSFRSRILDFGAQVEVNFAGFWITDQRKRSSPYGFLGFSVFNFDPQAQTQGGNWVSLQPLGTEGQGTTRYNDRQKYSLTQVSIPFGAGYKIAFNQNWSMGIEIGARKTFTDYLDDVSKTYVSPELLRATHGGQSAQLADRTDEVVEGDFNRSPGDQRGNPTRDDWYGFAGITFTYTIVPGTCYTF